MREVAYGEYLEFVSRNKRILIEDQEIALDPVIVKRFHPSSNELRDVSTTVWSFPIRGSWATHKGDYRGNWAPQIPRALINMYTEPGDLVLDPMVGSGTTCIEARLLGRNCIGVDINYNAVILTLHRLYWLEESVHKRRRRVKTDEEGNVLETWSKVYHGDARRLTLIQDNSIDLIATHPPYWNIIEYSGETRVKGDLSKTETLEEYLSLMKDVAKELYRVLKPGRYLGLLVGDTRIHKHYVPVTHYVLRVFMNAGFILKEEVVKIQHKMKTTREVWSRVNNRDYLLIYHEKLFIFRKPVENQELNKYRYSTGAIT